MVYDKTVTGYVHNTLICKSVKYRTAVSMKGLLSLLDFFWPFVHRMRKES